jgi:small conductance mechanosensitive channel
LGLFAPSRLPRTATLFRGRIEVTSVTQVGRVLLAAMQNDSDPGTAPDFPGAELLPPWVTDLLGQLSSSLAWQFVVVVVLTAIGVVVSKYVVRLLGRPIAKRFRRQSIAQTVLGAARLTVVFFFFLIGGSLVGLEFGNIVLSVTVFSAVLGIVLAPIVGSLINGIFVLADRPYEIGDMVEIETGSGNTTRGFVDDITLRYTKVFSLDNTFLVIPNGSARDRTVTNLSAEDERTRLSLSVLVTYESDLNRARDLIERAAADCEDVIEGGPDIRIGAARYPAGPTSYIDEFGDDGVLLTLRYWVARPYKLLTMRSRVQTRAWDLLLDEPDVEMAYPHRHLVFDSADTSEHAEGMLDGGPVEDGSGRPSGEGSPPE